MKLGILTTLWGRYGLTILFLDRLKHIADSFDAIAVAVGTGGEFRKECGRRGILYVDHDNRPLGSKWNAGIKVFENLPISNVMILGSDDFVSDDFIEHSMRICEGKDFCGCNDLYMFGANLRRRGKRQFFYFAYPAYLVGPGRCYSRRVLESLGWVLWNGQRNTGLDSSAAKRVRKVEGLTGNMFSIKKEGLFMVDIKTDGNISGIPGAAQPLNIDFGDMLNKHLPYDEAGNIIDYLKKIGI